MNKKLIGIILIIISLLIGLALIYFWFFYNPAPQQAQETKTTTSTTPVVTTTVSQPVVVLPKPKDMTPAPATELSEESARQVAGSFAELFGSYSNQGDLSRLDDLKFYVTPAYLERISKLSGSINDNYTVYSGHTARAIATQILIMEESRAVMMITTMRFDINADGTQRSYNQNIKVELVKSARSWKVDNAVWQ